MENTQPVEDFEDEEIDQSNFSATYSPEDNKLRLYSVHRLDTELYNRVRAAGFRWAPKQDLFVAPMWTPDREALLIELAGEVGDEDTSLVDRAEERADRFQDYSRKRAADAESAKNGVKAISDHIPFGQPILVGHHSEKRARKDAEKIENGMRKAVQMWETSAYWKDRAAGAIRHAKYKERPDVRARRIKKIEASRRKSVKERDEARRLINLWFNPMIPFTKNNAMAISGFGFYSYKFPLDKYPRELPASQYEGSMSLYHAIKEGIVTKRQARNLHVPGLERTIRWSNIWINHYDNRLLYERAMLAEGGGLKADKFDFKIGGQVKHRYGWSVISRINKKEGVITSVSLIASGYPYKVNAEEIFDYTPPTAEEEKKVKALTKLPPLCNYVTENCATMTQAEYKDQYKDHKGTMIINEPGLERHRIRTVSGFIGRKHGAITKNQWDSATVFISDGKLKNPATVLVKEKIELPKPKVEVRQTRTYKQPERTEFDDIKDSLKNGGVQTVSAPQLFPTPMEIAKRMVEEAAIDPGTCVLEPSAGTGNLIQAIIDSVDTEIRAYEINQELCNTLSQKFPSYKLHVEQGDFLKVVENQGEYHRIIMNPPFEKGSDILHIKHAIKFLRSGGRLVALCANGPRQEKILKPLAEESGGFWEALPAGSFKQSGTNVNVAMLVYEG